VPVRAQAGYAIVPRLLERVAASQLDAVFISHGHPDHCADLNPLLRARALGDDPAPPLPVYALPGALDAVLALDRPGMLAGAFTLHEFAAGSRLGTSRSSSRIASWMARAQRIARPARLGSPGTGGVRRGMPGLR
jgi:ribonuclease BN (tRNA processing enzyme)